MRSQPRAGAGRGRGGAQGGVSTPSQAAGPACPHTHRAVAPGVVNTARGVSGLRAAAESEFEGEGREHQRRDELSQASEELGQDTSHFHDAGRPDSGLSPRAGLPCHAS